MGKARSFLSSIWFWISLLFVGVIASFAIYFHLQSRLIPEVEQRMRSIRTLRTNQVIELIDKQMEELRAVASNIPIDNQAYFFTSDQKLRSTGFKNIFLTSVEGKILASTTEGWPQGGDLLSGPLSTSSLALSVARVLMTLSDDVSSVSFNPQSSEPELFLSTALFRGGKLIGVVSAQADLSKIYAISQDLTDLGKTGMVIFLQSTSTEDALLLTPLRYEARRSSLAKKYLLNRAPAMWQYALQAQNGEGVVSDLRGHKAIGAWGFIPRLNWGIVTKIDLTEVSSSVDSAKLISYIFSFLFTGFFLYALIISRRIFTKAKGPFSHLFRIFTWRAVPILIFCISASLLLYLLHNFRKAKNDAFSQTETTVQLEADQAAQTLNYALYQIQMTSASIADDLATGRLAQENIEKRMEREIGENPALSGLMIAFAPLEKNSPQIAVFSALRQQEKVTFQKNEVLPEKLLWYTEAAKGKAVWMDPSSTLIAEEEVALIATPIFSAIAPGKIIGVVASYKKMDELRDILSKIHLNFQQGYPYLVTKEGVFLHYPNEEYVSKRETLFDLATEMASPKLNQISEEILTGKQGTSSFEDEITDEQFWISYTPITITQWRLGVILSETATLLSSQELQYYYLRILIASIAALLSATFIFCYAHSPTSPYFIGWATFSTLVLATGIFFLWKIVQVTSSTPMQQSAIHNPVELTQFLTGLKQKAASINESPPTPLPTGVYIYSIEFPDDRHVTFSLFVWQKFREGVHEEIKQGFILPQAMGWSSITEIYRQKEGGEETVGWLASLTAPHYFQFSRYPIDTNMLNVAIQHRSLGDHVVLVPDLNSYPELRPDMLPGIAPSFSLPGFSIQKSFFSLESKAPGTNFGLENNQQTSASIEFKFNILLKRDILEFLNTTLLPLFIIMIAIFCFLAATAKESSATVVIGSYIALAFVIILMHSSLRARFQTSEILYAEYFFFSIYFTLAILMIHVIGVRIKTSIGDLMRKTYPYFVVLFWPIQFTSLFILTLIAFFDG